jgi:hypothetical protein
MWHTGLTLLRMGPEVGYCGLGKNMGFVGPQNSDYEGCCLFSCNAM